MNPTGWYIAPPPSYNTLIINKNRVLGIFLRKVRFGEPTSIELDSLIGFFLRKVITSNQAEQSLSFLQPPSSESAGCNEADEL